MLEEDFLDLLGQLSQKAPLHEIWQQTGTLSPTGSSAELAVFDLQVRSLHTMQCLLVMACLLGDQCRVSPDGVKARGLSLVA